MCDAECGTDLLHLTSSCATHGTLCSSKSFALLGPAITSTGLLSATHVALSSTCLPLCQRFACACFDSLPHNTIVRCSSLQLWPPVHLVTTDDASVMPSAILRIMNCGTVFLRFELTRLHVREEESTLCDAATSGATEDRMSVPLSRWGSRTNASISSCSPRAGELIPQAMCDIAITVSPENCAPGPRSCLEIWELKSTPAANDGMRICIPVRLTRATATVTPSIALRLHGIAARLDEAVANEQKDI